MAGIPQFPNLATYSPLRLPRRLAPRTVPDSVTAADPSCAINTKPCFKALSGIGRIRRFGRAAGELQAVCRPASGELKNEFGSWAG